MGATDTFELDLCTLLAAALGTTFDPDALIADGATNAIVRGALPPEAASGVGVQAYTLTPDPASADAVQSVQLWIRGDDAYVRDTADAIFAVLAGAVNLTVGTTVCPMVNQHSDVGMGLDDLGRRERALNYDFTVTRPTPGRPD